MRQAAGARPDLLTNPTPTAAEPLAIGLVTKVVPDPKLTEAALAYYMRSLAAGAPKALAATKRLLWRSRLSLDACLPEEARAGQPRSRCR